MPCYITGSAEGDARLAAEKVGANAARLTRLLCRTLKWLEKNDPHTLRNLLADRPTVGTWWDKHKAIDQKRKIKRLEV